MRTSLPARIFLHISFLLCGALSITETSAQDTRYWVGGSGEWNDASHWSASPGGNGGAGVPDRGDRVTIAPASGGPVIHITGATVGALLIDGSHCTVRLEGATGKLRISGDLELRGGVDWRYAGTVEMTAKEGIAEVDLRGIPVAGDMSFSGGGTWSMKSDLVLADDRTLELSAGTLVTNGNMVRAGFLRFDGHQSKRFMAGSSVVLISEAFEPGGAHGVVDPGTSRLIIQDQLASWGTDAAPVEADVRAVNLCGTGAGQTLFTIDAQLLSNYNGFGVSCHGVCNGSVNVTVTGGVGPFTYSWVGGPAAATWNNACPGNQIVIVTDQGQGISCATTVQVTDPAPLSVIFFGNIPPSCASVCDGTANAFAVGGVPAYDYSWNNGAGTGSSFNGLCPGVNTLHVTDANMCPVDTSFSFLVLPITPDLVITNAHCSGTCDGTAAVSPTGGTGGFSYDWEPGTPVGDGTSSVAQLCPGSYSVTIVDANGCDTTVQFQVTAPAPIIPHPSHTNATCASSCDGMATVAPTGAVGPYGFNWSPVPSIGQGTPTASGLCAGTYQVTITDNASGCDTTVTITITAPAPLIPNGSSTDALCSNSCDGSATVAPVGGTPPYGYAWSPLPPAGQGTPVATMLCPGLWSVVITDAHGCDTTVQFTISAPEPISPNGTQTDITCTGACDGTASVAPGGGTGPFTYVWLPNPPVGQGTPAASQLCPGPWSVTVSDANGCDTTVEFLITQPLPLVSTDSHTDETCGGNCDGTATASVSGGTPGYTYAWSPAPGGGQGTPTATGLCPGTWTLTITDANGCTRVEVFDIGAAIPLDLILQTTPASCPSTCDGTADVVVTGGIAAYSYLWSPVPGSGQGTPNVTGLCPQGWTLTVTDAVGCDTTATFTIPAPPPIIPNAVVANANCFGACDGSITLAPTGGTGTYTYAWTPVPANGDGTAQATGLCAGDHQVTIGSGVCDTTLVFTIAQPLPISATINTSATSCSSACDGTADVVVSGGTPGYGFLWTPAPASGQGTANASGFCLGPHTLTVTDAAGCDTVIDFIIDGPVPISVDLTVSDASCGALCDGGADVSPSGGTPGYSYVWSPAPGNGQGTPSVGGLCPGPYTLTITDAVGCDTTVQFLIGQPPPITVSSTIAPAQCSDVCDGDISLMASGGMPPYSWAWSPAPGSGQGTSHVSGLCPGTWTVTLGDQSSCDTTFSFTIGAPAPIIPNGASTNESCVADCDGTANVAPTGGDGTFTYLWVPDPAFGQGTPAVGGLCPGTWGVTITDGNGCDTTWSFIVLPAVPIQASVNTMDILCGETCAGGATVTASGGTGVFTYMWDPAPATGQGTATATGLCQGPGTVTVTDDAGCDTTLVFQIFKNLAIQPNLSVSDEDCGGPCSGEAAVAPFGGNGVYGYSWQPEPGGGQGTSVATGLCAGIGYSVTITDSNGCDTTVTFAVQPFTAILPNVTTTPASCADACNGAATTVPSGGVGTYTYFWDPVPPNGQGGPTATNLCAGTYQLTITDGEGCDTTVAIIIAAPDPIDPMAVIQPPACAGQCSGIITLAPVGGSGGYTYDWTPVPPIGQGTPQASALCAGDWNVVITDANGCDTSLTFILPEPLPLVDPAVTTSSHCGVCDGSITAHASGGTGPYLFTWGPPLNTTTTDSVQTGLCAGLYPLTVTDASGCSFQQTIAVADEDGEVLTVTNGSTSCPGLCDGTASVAFNCTVAPCAVAWSDIAGNDLGQPTDSASALCSGYYLVSVTNGDGCISIDTAQVTSPTGLVITTTTTPATCASNCDGGAIVGVNGGIGPFTFTWSPAPGSGQGTPIATGLCPGNNYDIAIDDLNGCDATASVTITAPQPLNVTATVSDIACAGQCNGSIALDAQGGAGTYTYNWTPVPPAGQGTAVASGLCPGTYFVTVADVNGCDTTLNFTLIDPLPLVLNGASTSSHCAVCDGTATLTVSGGSGVVDVTWTDASGAVVGTGTSLSGLCAGVYVAHATDAHGCTADQIFAISDVGGEALTVTDGQTFCANACEGEVSVNYLCSSAPCVVTWYDMTGDLLVQGPDTLSDLCPGSYLVQVVNATGCSSIDTASVVPMQVIIPNTSSAPVSCIGLCDGMAAVAPSGGLVPYTFVWSPEPGGGQGTSQATGLCAGTWAVTIADASGCDTTVNIVVPSPPSIFIDAQVDQVSCNGACDGSIVLSPSGGSGFFSFTWSPVPPNGQGSNAAFGLCPGDWSVTIADLQGCDTTVVYTITEPDTLAVAVTSTPSTCGMCSGTADAQAMGGVAPYVYTWTQGGAITATDSAVTDLCAGLFSITVTDAHGCTAQAAVPISDMDGEDVTTTDFLLACPDQCNGLLTAAFNCTAPNCTVSWFDASGADLNVPSDTLQDQCAGTYFVQVTNGSGCITLDSANVIAPPPIVANLSTSPENCPGSCDGTATVGPTGGVGGFIYAWSPEPGTGQGTSTAGGLCAGAFQVVITDTNNCSLTQDVLITSPSPITVSATVDPVTCNSSCDGSIDVTAQGGSGVLQFEWTPEPGSGQGTSSAGGLCAGDWSIHITDSNGCDTLLTFTLLTPPVLNVGLAQTDNVCFNDCEGTAHVEVTGGIAPYSIVWLDGGGVTLAQDTTTIGGLCAGDHSVTVSDSLGCPSTLPFAIATGAPIVADLIFQGESCNGPCDGQASVTPSGGSGSGFTVLWAPEPASGQGTEQVEGLCPGDWTVTLTDDAGCDTTYAFTILPFAPLVPIATVESATCNGSCDGSIALDITGGIAPYSYSWSPEPGAGQGTSVASGLCAGDWTVTVVDTAGCDTVITYVIAEPAALAVSETVTPASCSSASNGAIAITVSGGTPDYAFAWSGPGGFTSTDQDITDVPPGPYSLTVTDLNGCQVTVQMDVNALTTIVANAGADLNECAGIDIVLDGNASQGAITYLWMNEVGDTVGTEPMVVIENLPEGTHSFILTVADGPCTASDTAITTVLALPMANAGPDQTVYVQGTVTLGGAPSGPPGSGFAWWPDSIVQQPNAPNPSAFVNSTTLFVLTVTASDGCMNTDSVLVTVIPEVKVPSGFSPNGDGQNDIWQLDFVGQFPQMEVEVFNRWGESLYHSSGYRTPWDGRYKSGLVPVGTYYYTIDLHDPRYPDVLTGPVTVIR